MTAGTIFDKTRTPLTSGFAAAWYVTSQQNGVSAMRLKQLLRLGSYKTAWTMLHKLRRAKVCADRDRLSCAVEVDETYVGGQTEKQAIVAIAVEVHEPPGLGRVPLRRVPDASASSLLPFVREALESGAEVPTDGWGGYSGLAKHGYMHKKTALSSSGDPAHVSLPAVHRVSSLLQRWLLRTHQGAVRPDQLDRYLDELTFRFNGRSSRSRGLLFYRLLEQAALTSAAPYRFIVGGKPRFQHIVAGGAQWIPPFTDIARVQIRRYRTMYGGRCGMPETGDDRLRIADRLLTGLTDAGLAIEDICLDHLMMPFGVNQMPGAEVLETTQLVRARYPEFTSFPTFPMFHRDYRKDEFLIALLC